MGHSGQLGAGPDEVDPPDSPSSRLLSATEAGLSLLDRLGIGTTVLDDRGKVLLWGPVATGILGWPDREIIGRHLSELLPGGHASAGAAIYRIPPTRGQWYGTLSMIHRDGHTVDVECRATLLRGETGTPMILANLAETTRLRALEQDLAALDALFNSSPLGIAIFDTEQRYVRVNEALSRIHGAPVERLLGRRVTEVLAPPLSLLVERVQREVLRTGRPVIDLITSSADGRGARSISFGRLTDSAGNTLGVSCTVFDVTERRETLVKLERTRKRLAMLDSVGSALGNLLDVDRIAKALADLLVPRFADYLSVALLRPVVRGGELPDPTTLAEESMIRLAVGAKRPSPHVDRMMAQGEEFPVRADEVIGAAVMNGTPQLFNSADEVLATAPGATESTKAAQALGPHSLITAPLPARGTVLGAITLARAGPRARYDEEDLALTTELAARAGISLDNARLYARERERALMLQRSLLPRSIPEVPGVSVSYRYVPSGTAAEVGGDWFDVVPLERGRVAFVVGDVTGHGLHAAATMGRLRTAVRTLAGLDLHPAELLRRVNDLSADIAEHDEDPLMGTCVYAVYDPVAGVCTLAKAGHLPPLLIGPDPAHPASRRWVTRRLELPSGAPLGADGVTFEERRIEVPPRAMLVLYTDGLVETRGGDIDEGVDALCARLDTMARPGTPLQELCDSVIAGLSPRAVSPHGAPGQGPEDDIALLVARLGPLDEPP